MYLNIICRTSNLFLIGSPLIKYYYHKFQILLHKKHIYLHHPSSLSKIRKICTNTEDINGIVVSLNKKEY